MSDEPREDEAAEVEGEAAEVEAGTDGELAEVEAELEAADAEGGRLAALAKLRLADGSPRVLNAARAVRRLLPGDSELGDPLSMAGDDPSLVLARRVAEVGQQRPSALRELGLGAFQVWQAISEKQGRGRGDRELAILFTDLVEYSTWALEAGDEASLALLREVGRAEDSAVAEHGGRVVKRLGDGLMAVFNDPQEAVLAACDVRERVAAIEQDGYRPRLRAGVHLGRPRRIGGDYLGVDVNIAARVADAASGDQILISGPTCDRLEDGAFKCKRQRRFKAKGAPKGLEVFAVEPA
ncbi:MAG TPA: adenylate/guanylate cyclase domain-containing protein [Thermoleophilaceae bacterium]